MEDVRLEVAKRRQEYFFSLERVQNKKQVRTGGLIPKNKIYRIFFEFKEKTGFEFPPPPLSVVLTPHCVHHIKITQERYKIIKVIGKMY